MPPPPPREAASNPLPPQQGQPYQGRQYPELLEKIANSYTSPEDRSQWLRQLADMVSASVQSNVIETRLGVVAVLAVPDSVDVAVVDVVVVMVLLL